MTCQRAQSLFCLVLVAALAWADNKPAKFTAPAIQIEPVEAGNSDIPAEFRYAIYERLIERVRRDGEFAKVFRSGDRDAAGVAGLVVLRATVSRFKEGSETKRKLTTVAGSTAVDVAATVSKSDGSVVWNNIVSGKVRYFGENLGVANDVAKRIAKLLRESTQP
jgi:hypothetical protein